MSLPLQLGARLLAVTLAAGPAAPVKPAPVAPSTPEGAMSPLLRVAKDLRCAYDEELARKALVPLRRADTSALGLPDESLGQEGTPRLYAATLDAVLEVLGQTAARFPGMRREVEAVALSWSYCEVNHGNAPWDLVVEGGQRVRRPAASPFPAERRGFARWGFHAQDPADRYVPELITRSGLAPGQLELFLHELRLQRCFPDAWNGSTVFDAPEPFFAGPVPARAEPQAASGRYPYVPSATCPPPPPPRVGVRAVHEGVLATARSAKAVREQTGAVAARSPAAGMVRDAARRAAARGQTPGPAFTGAVSSVLGLLAPTGEVLKGTVFVSFPLADRPFLGVSAIYTPHSYFFVRGGLNYLFTAERNEEPLTWSWGFGYDDWHPGTFSVQVNRWEPVLLSKGLAIEQAVLNLGYKLPRPCVGQFCLSTFASVDIPYNLDVTPTVRFTVTFQDVWFVMGGIGYNLGREPRRPRITYGIGRLDWRPFAFNVTYFNWSGDPGPLNGMFTLSLNWTL